MWGQARGDATTPRSGIPGRFGDAYRGHYPLFASSLGGLSAPSVGDCIDRNCRPPGSYAWPRACVGGQEVISNWTRSYDAMCTVVREDHIANFTSGISISHRMCHITVGASIVRRGRDAASVVQSRFARSDGALVARHGRYRLGKLTETLREH